MVDSNEKDLLLRARQFDLDALAEIFDLYNDLIYSYAFRLLGEPDKSEECVAETFSRLLHALRAGLGPQEHLKPYLYRIAHNWITDQFRRKEAVPFPDEQGAALIAPDNTEKKARENIEIEEVRLALRKLTPEQQQVVVLKYVEGWDNEEVAVSLNKPVGAVKSLQHRALNTLRRLLEKEAYENVS